MRCFWFYCLFAASLCSGWEKIVYPLTRDPIDVVIPCCAKDLDALDLCIGAIRRYGENIRRVIVISKERLTEHGEWFDESLFPFNKQSVALEAFWGDSMAAHGFLKDPQTRIGWIYQQLLKLYAPFTIPDLSPNVLILDADVCFVKPVSFMGEQGEPLFAVAREHHPEYFHHAARLLSGFKKVYLNHSGVTHHMLFQRPILEDLFEKIVDQHGIAPWRAIARCIDLHVIHQSSLSEYEIYFNFALSRTDQAKIRPLRWVNIGEARLLPIYSRVHSNVDFLTCHSWAGSPIHR